MKHRLKKKWTKIAATHCGLVKEILCYEGERCERCSFKDLAAYPPPHRKLVYLLSRRTIERARSFLRSRGLTEGQWKKMAEREIPFWRTLALQSKVLRKKELL